MPPRYPALYQINTRVWLTELSRALGRRVTLAEVPDGALDALATRGFDWVWLLSVWQTGAAGRAVSRARAARRPGACPVRRTAAKPSAIARWWSPSWE